VWRLAAFLGGRRWSAAGQCGQPESIRRRVSHRPWAPLATFTTGNYFILNIILLLSLSIFLIPRTGFLDHNINSCPDNFKRIVLTNGLS